MDPFYDRVVVAFDLDKPDHDSSGRSSRGEMRGKAVRQAAKVYGGRYSVLESRVDAGTNMFVVTLQKR